MGKQFYDQIVQKLPYILIVGFCVVWLRGAITGKYELSFDEHFRNLFLIPAIVAWYFANILANVNQGRFLFALPKFFRYTNRSRATRALFVIQIVIFYVASTFFLLNWFVLIPQLSDDGATLLKLNSHIRLIYSWLGVTDLPSAARFVQSEFWTYYIFAIIIFGSYILYRKFIEYKVMAKLIEIYSEQATTAIKLREFRTDQTIAGDMDRCLKFVLKRVKEASTIGLITNLLSWITRSVFCGFVLVPDPDKPHQRLVNIAAYCSRDSWAGKIEELARLNKPAILNIDNLVACWNECFNNTTKKFNLELFKVKKNEHISAAGMAFSFERPKIVNFADTSMYLRTSYRDNLIMIDGKDGEISKALKFRSYLTLPIKHEAKVVAVIFVGSTRPFSFSNSTLPLLERYSHSVGEIIAMLEELGPLLNLENQLVAIFENAKAYWPSHKRSLVRKSLREINRMFLKGVRHAKPINPPG